MIDYFVYDGVDSREFGIVVFEKDTFGAPSRSYTVSTVPGRNGTLYLDDKRYANQPHSYECVIYQDFLENLDDFRNFIASRRGYKRLSDSIHPDEFYHAVYKNSFVVTIDSYRSMGKFTLEFDRKPQRFLVDGEEQIEITSDGVINNPTYFDAKPLLRVYGTGTVGINDNAITINEADEYTDVDCENMEAYKGAESCNDYIEIQNIDFPAFVPGENSITLGEGITSIVITPRWYKL